MRIRPRNLIAPAGTRKAGPAGAIRFGSVRPAARYGGVIMSRVEYPAACTSAV